MAGGLRREFATMFRCLPWFHRVALAAHVTATLAVVVMVVAALLFRVAPPSWVMVVILLSPAGTSALTACLPKPDFSDCE